MLSPSSPTMAPQALSPHSQALPGDPTPTCLLNLLLAQHPPSTARLSLLPTSGFRAGLPLKIQSTLFDAPNHGASQLQGGRRQGEYGIYHSGVRGLFENERIKITRSSPVNPSAHPT